MDLNDILNEELFIMDLQARSKEEVLSEISERFCSVYPAHNREAVYDSLVKREGEGSTGFGNEVAIPHTKMREIGDFHLMIVKSRKGVPFDAADKKKVRLLFVIFGPDEKQGDYIRILAQVARVAGNNYAKDELLASRTPETLKENFLKYLPSETGSHQGDLDQKKLMIVTLYETKYYDEIIEILLSNGIKGISTFETMGTVSILSRVPLFSQVLNFTADRLENSQTILCITDKNRIGNIVSDMEKILGNLDKVTGASVIALDLFYSKGSFEAV